jgi:hypothetical protein
MRGILTFAISACVGYFFFLYLSHPKKRKIYLPRVKISRLEIFPHLRLHIGKKTYWFHHWFYLSLLIAIPVIIGEGFIFPLVIDGILVGGIFQGLTYSDRFQFRHPRLDQQIEDFKKEIKVFTENVASGKIFEPQQKEEKKN